jgi:hypothetical protein
MEQGHGTAGAVPLVVEMESVDIGIAAGCGCGGVRSDRHPAIVKTLTAAINGAVTTSGPPNRHAAFIHGE